jgi:hypothetical protein
MMCPVCGFDKLHEEPWSKNGGGSQEICRSCGIQFGYTDDAGGDPVARVSLWQRWREAWIRNGMKWSSVGSRPPEGWDPVEQLKNIAGDDPPGAQYVE